jgi:hypothetical protein
VKARPRFAFALAERYHARVDREAIPEALAARGVPLFAARSPLGLARVPPADLIEACIASGNPRFKLAVIPLDSLAGRLALRALAEEIAAVEGPELDWEATLLQPARQLIEELWFERRRRNHASAG